MAAPTRTLSGVKGRAIKRMCQLERMRDAEEKGFVGNSADELQAHGQTVRCKPARDRNRRKAAQIRWAVIAEE